MDLDDDERLWSGAHDVGAELAQACARLRDKNPYPDLPDPPLDHLINFLMTELWDRNFSQTEIRRAFEEALKDMNRYASGHERRSGERSS
jgi:hypothetical protein